MNNLAQIKKPTTYLFNPFLLIAGWEALLLGLGAMLIAGAIGSVANTHFDGVLDMHSGAAAPLWVFFVEGIIDWLCLALVLLGAGKIISPTSFRAIDVLGTQALARWPTIVLSLSTLPKGFQRFINDLLEQVKQGKPPQFNVADMIVFFVIVVVMLVFLCWMVMLMYKAFSVSCNVKGGKAIGVFIAGLLIAEVLSKLCLVPILVRTVVPPTA